jgi:hypothetical protein
MEGRPLYLCYQLDRTVTLKQCLGPVYSKLGAESLGAVVRTPDLYSRGHEFEYHLDQLI